MLPSETTTPPNTEGVEALGTTPLDPVPPVVDIPPVLLGPWSYLCGPAGTGKTTLARAIVDQHDGTVLAATTGIAAVNLGEGTTINALLGYFDTASLVEAYTSGYLHVRLRKLYKAGVTRILLDEVSMLDAVQLTCLTRALQEIAERRSPDMETNDLMADSGVTDTPIALTLIGDFAQLPPVKCDFAFQSPVWPQYAAAAHTLTRIWRQTDPGFLTALQAARRGEADPVCAYFAGRLATTLDLQFPGPTLFATNDEVARYNQLRLDQLPTPTITFASSRWGKAPGEWKQIPETVDLKVGALVMLLANVRYPDSEALLYANGDLGTITDIQVSGSRVYVRLHRTEQEVCVDWVTRDHKVPLEPGRVSQLKAAGEADRIIRSPSGKAQWERVGQITYLPIRLAWGTTVHKSQGLSLDAVQVNTRAGFFRTPGLLYVALSRCRTAEGLRLIGSVDGLRARCVVDARVRGWL